MDERTDFTAPTGTWVEDTIPAEVLSKLHALRPVLERQGAVFPHRHHFQIRYRAMDQAASHIRRKALTLGDGTVATVVQRLLDGWRQERQLLDDQEEAREQARQRAAAAARRSEKEKVRCMRRMALALAGGGYRRRQKIARWFNRTLEDPAEAMRFHVTGEFPPYGHAGRPIGGGLW